MGLRAGLAALLVGLALGACSAPHSGTVRAPFLHAFGLVFVELELDHEPLLALLDTGANASAVDSLRSSHLASLGSAEVLGTTGTLQVEMVALEHLTLGPRTLPPLRATRRDLGGLLSPDGRRVELILGSDALAGAALTLDFGARELEFADGADLLRGADGGVPMGLDQGIPMVEASLAGFATRLRIDTGASLFDTPDVYVNVPQHLWSELSGRDPGLAPESSLLGTGADGSSVELPVVPLAEVTIAGRPLERVFLIVQPRAGYFAAPESLGFVSNNWLETLGRVTLDYRAQRLIVEPRSLR